MYPKVFVPKPGGSALYNFSEDGANFIDLWRMAVGWKEHPSNIILDLKDSDMVVIPERMKAKRIEI